MALEIRTSKAIKKGNLALVVNPDIADVVKQFILTANKNKILKGIAIRDIINIVAQADKVINKSTEKARRGGSKQ